VEIQPETPLNVDFGIKNEGQVCKIGLVRGVDTSGKGKSKCRLK
jgi:hypothetical protein